MTSKSTVAIVLSIVIVLLALPSVTCYVPQPRDHFSYYEVQNLGSGTGDYQGYSEQTIINGVENMNSISAGGIVSANYSYSYTWTNSSGATETGSPAGDYTFSANTFLYVNGTDDQTGYVNPTVWFLIDTSIPEGSTFTLLNTDMTVISRSASYYLQSENRDVQVIFAQAKSSYQRDDVYGQFTATFTWNVFFDPATGYIVGYDYIEQDTNSSGTGFPYTERLYVQSTSYPLTTSTTGTPIPSPTTGNPIPTATPTININTGNLANTIFLGLIVAIVVIIIVIAILAIALSRRRRTLPKHPYSQPPPPPSPPPQPPENINLTPKQPEVQQIVIKEVVKVNCRYCGALIDSTAKVCPYCGAPRT